MAEPFIPDVSVWQNWIAQYGTSAQKTAAGVGGQAQMTAAEINALFNQILTAPDWMTVDAALRVIQANRSQMSATDYGRLQSAATARQQWLAASPAVPETTGITGVDPLTGTVPPTTQPGGGGLFPGDEGVPGGGMLGQWGVPVGPTEIPPESVYFGYDDPRTWDVREGRPELGWLKKLQAGGLLGETPAGRWMQGQYPDVYNRWRRGQLVSGMEGQPLTPWFGAETQWRDDPSLWGRLQALPEAGAFAATNPEDVYRMAASARTGGAGGPFGAWMQADYPRFRSRWEAFDDPGAPGSTGTPWMEALMRRMGL